MHGKCVGVLTTRKRKQKQRRHWKSGKLTILCQQGLSGQSTHNL